MSEDKFVNNDELCVKINIEEILDACARRVKNSDGSEDSEEGLKVFLKYFHPQKRILDINKPLDGQGKWNPLAFATYFGKVKEIFELVKLGAKPNIELDNKMNVLHIAATEGKDSLCTFFLNNGVDINSKCENGTTALMRACEAGHLDVVKSLVAFHPDIMVKDKAGKTCIDYCRDNNFFNLIKYINNYYLNSTLPTSSKDDIPLKKLSKI